MKNRECFICRSLNSLSRHHIVPKNWIKRYLENSIIPEEFRSNNIEKFIRELKGNKRTVYLCRRCHDKMDEKMRGLKDEIWIACNSRCSDGESCLYRRKGNCKIESSNDSTCDACKFFRNFDVLNFYGWFAGEFGKELFSKSYLVKES